MRRHADPTRHPTTRPRRRGLSLLEVLLALAILVLSLAAISRLVDNGTDSGAAARALVRGNRLAQSKMGEVQAGLLPVSTTSTGQFDGDDAAWTYTVTSAPVTAPASPPNLYAVTVRASRDLLGKQFDVSLTQMLFDPTLMGTAAQAEATSATTGSTAGTTTGATGTTGGTTSGTGGTSP